MIADVSSTWIEWWEDDFLPSGTVFLTLMLTVPDLFEFAMKQLIDLGRSISFPSASFGSLVHMLMHDIFNMKSDERRSPTNKMIFVKGLKSIKIF